ncbi:MAG: fumarylacetoacetate hydrolase family protein, partial [archaeon]|nr:fumarylacetoacetate hydrolase family protein [archaeon]
MKKIILPIKGSNEIYEIKATKIICLGLNYADHIAEDSVAHVAGTKTKGEPVLFPKFPNVLIGNGDDIVYHNILNEIKQDRVDYEGELAIIIKKAGKNIPKIKINDYILGYTCFNDVTARLMQKEDISNKRPWLKSKSLDTFGPIGPQIVKPEDIGNINNLTIETRL